MIWIVWIVFCLLTIEQYHKKGYGWGIGLMVGIMLGPLGFLIALTRDKVD